MAMKRNKKAALDKKTEQIEQDCLDAGLPIKELLVRRLAHQQVILDEMEEKWLQGDEINLEMFNRGMNSMVRLMKEIGLLQMRSKPKYAKDEPRTLDEYVATMNGGGRNT